MAVLKLTWFLLSGLRIAPPEAPVTGYMFGKGVYFADMFSKSANYCYASQTSRSGVLLLCEVCLSLSPPSSRYQGLGFCMLCARC